ncbi:MAG: chorismate mutase [bacterium]|nr:MAG: chorismate mutase [bacterium]
MSKPESLEDRRRRIDDLDRRLMEILLERATLVRAIAREKRATGIDLIDPDREDEIMDHLHSLGAGQLPEPELDQVIDALRELMQMVAEEPEH